jgi:hypothetical protein
LTTLRSDFIGMHCLQGVVMGFTWESGIVSPLPSRLSVA